MAVKSRFFVVTLCVIGLLGSLWLFPPLAHAQGNLIRNPAFEDHFTSRGNIGGTVPVEWEAWGSFDRSDRETLSALVRSSAASWRLRKEYGLATGGGYQVVTGVQNGALYRFTIHAMIWTCDDGVNSCRNETSTFSDTRSGGRVRIGIDPRGGTNPFSGDIVWSGFISPFNWGTFEPLLIEARAQNTQITVFTYYTADVGMRFMDVFWDDAAMALMAPAGGSGNTGNNNTNNPTAPSSTRVPIVADPQSRPDGSVVHIVRSGDTLSGIARAYNVSLQTIFDLNGLNSTSIIRPGQEIIIQSAARPVASPSGSTPVIAIPGTATVTSIAANLPTRAALAFTPTPTQQAVVDVDAADDESDTLGQVVPVLAVVVIAGAAVAMMGLVGFVGYTAFRR